MAHAPADLARRRPEQDQVVAGAQRILCGEGAFHLARAPFVLDRAQRQAERFVSLRERAEDRLHQVHVGFGMIGIAGFRGRRANRPAAQAGNPDMLVAQRFLRDLGQVPLYLQPDAQLVALAFHLSGKAAQQLARREMEWRAAVEVFVAQYPAHAGGPGQHAERRWIRNDGQIR